MADQTRDPGERRDDATVSSDRTRTSSGVEPSAVGGTRIPAEVAGYRILGIVGEGGMGVVLEAEQHEPRRRVALKMIRGGAFASARALAMFQREVATLARLKHPGIASIHAAGTTDDGQPFLAMELVAGVTLGAWIARERPALDRAELEFRFRVVRKIALAVHYAHQRGVIHRDLKPGNILVSTEVHDSDGLPEIKILDFGLARLADDDAAGAGKTEVGAVKGTLGYMSPEQARGNPDEIDTRTDVYALGVILYECLTGRRPHDLERASFVDAIRTISDRPVRPLREAWPTGVGRLDPDVETIVHTALASDVERRYSGADALARDIGRFLAREPILARPPSTAYHVRKFAQRNRALVGGIVATVFVLVAGIVVSTALGLGEARQRRAAEEARNDLEQVVSFQAKTLSDVDPEVTGRRLMAAIGRQLDSDPTGGGDLLDRLGSRLNPTDLARAVLDENILAPAAAAAAREFAGRPSIEARLHHTLAATYEELGLFDEAAAQFGRAAALRAEALGERSPETLASRARAARVDALRGRRAEALAGLDRLIALESEVLGADDPLTLRTRYDRATVAYEQGDYGAALAGYREIHGAQARALGAEHPDTLQTLSAIGSVLHGRGEYGPAAEAFEAVLEARSRTLGPDAELTLTTLGNLASVRTAERRHDEAERLYREVIDRLTVTHGEEYPRTLRAMANLGVLYTRTGRTEEAYRLSVQALDVRRRVLGRAHPETTMSMNNVAVLLTRLGRHDEAAAMLDEVLAVDERYAAGSSDHAIHLHTYAEMLIDRGRWAEARSKMERALSIYRRTGHAYLGGALVQAAGIEARDGRPDAALARLREAVERGAGESIRADDPAFASLRGDPRFDALCAKVAEAAAANRVGRAVTSPPAGG